jgi:hypothetical protein
MVLKKKKPHKPARDADLLWLLLQSCSVELRLSVASVSSCLLLLFLRFFACLEFLFIGFLGVPGDFTHHCTGCSAYSRVPCHRSDKAADSP